MSGTATRSGSRQTELSQVDDRLVDALAPGRAMTLQLSLLALAVLTAGAVVGLLAGLFGVGGGTVVVPVLYEVFFWFGVPEEVRMPLCAGTSLALIIPTSIASFTTHQRAASIDFNLLRKWLLPIVFGVFVGVLLARYASASLFKIVFVVVASTTALRILFPDWLPRMDHDIPSGLIAPYGLAIGASAALAGIGGGLLSNIAMILHGRSIHQAVATSSGVGVLVSIPGTLGFMAVGYGASGLPPFSVGFVCIAAVLMLMPASFLMAKAGARLAHTISRHHLELAFAAYLILVSVRFCVSLILA